MATVPLARPSEECRIPSSVVNDLAERTIAGRKTEAFICHSHDSQTATRWLSETISAICRLPWDDNSRPDDRKPPQPAAAANLLWLLINVLEENTLPPTSIIPTWRGGVQAEWHVNGFDLEIDCSPDGSIEYNFAGPNVEEYEGPIDETLEQLRAHVRLLPYDRR